MNPICDIESVVFCRGSTVRAPGRRRCFHCILTSDNKHGTFVLEPTGSAHRVRRRRRRRQDKETQRDEIAAVVVLDGKKEGRKKKTFGITSQNPASFITVFA